MEKKNIIISIIVALIFTVIIYVIYYLTKNIKHNDDKHNDDKHQNDNSKCLYNPPPSKPPVSNCDKDLNSPPDPEIEYTNKKQVFNIGNNIFTYDDAPAVCKAYGAKLATYEQVKSAYDQGANWCNYGWTEGKMALYPIQYKSWKKIQSGPEKYRNSCGKPGLNGGYFENSNLKFGVNCYGKKPETRGNNKTDIECPFKYLDEETINFNNKVDGYKTKLDDYTILPFNKKEWSD